MRVAIMQPYFMPYAGYFRLMAQSDIFVIYDCVQFVRRGWIHRNKFRLVAREETDWLTLPLKKSSRDSKIKDICFTDNANQEICDRIQRFEIFRNKKPSEICSRLCCFGEISNGEQLVPYLEKTLITVAENLRVTPKKVIRSSELNVPDKHTGEARIIHICHQLQATEYLNAPGGRDLYDIQTFKQAGISLKFLPPYPGPYANILERCATESVGEIRKELN